MNDGKNGSSTNGSPPDGDTEKLEDQPPMVRAATWATRATTASLMMVVPGLIGYWVDSMFGIVPALTITGFALGMIAGMYQLVQLTSSSNKK